MKKLFSWFTNLSKTIRILLIIGVIAFGFIGLYTFQMTKSANPAYQTGIVEKGNLVVSVSVSGQVSSANSAQVSTQASGVVRTVYVKDGDMVKAGQRIADIDLDITGSQRSQAAYANYHSAQNNLETARANLYSSRATMLTEWESYMSKAQNSTYENADDSPNSSNRQLSDFVITQDEWLASEAKYKVQEKAIAQAQTAVSSAWYSYQQSSPTIVAPISGTVTGLSLQPGNVITAQTNTSGTSTSQRIASVKTNASPTVGLNITQIDAPKVKAGNKATVTFDAFAEKTFTGVVVSVDTIGTEVSGVTTYPAIIKLDTEVPGLLPNMSAQATIITATKSDVLLVPSTAIVTENGTKYVRIMRKNQMTQVEVETGLTNDSQTEIISGLNEGDTIITTVSSGGSTTTGTGSPFSPFGGSRNSGGGGNRRTFMIGG